MARHLWLTASFAAFSLLGCGGSSASVTGLKIVSASSSSAALTAQVGGALQLAVVQELSDGSTKALPASAGVAWSGIPTVAALDPSSAAASPIPSPGATPTAFFIANAGRPDHATDLSGVVFVMDGGTSGAGTISVNANVTGVSGFTTASVSIAVTAAPTGNATNGQTLYAANCAACHGTTGAGSPPLAGASDTFSLEGKTYGYPAPGLNAIAGNVAGDPDWTVALFAIGSRADMDNGGLTLRAPMPDWLAETVGTTNQPLSTQDFYDMYAYMATQTQ